MFILLKRLLVHFKSVFVNLIHLIPHHFITFITTFIDYLEFNFPINYFEHLILLLAQLKVTLNFSLDFRSLSVDSIS